MNTKLYATIAILLAIAFLPTTATAVYYAKTCPTQQTKADVTAIVQYDNTDCGTAEEGGPSPECDSALPCPLEECEIVIMTAAVDEALPTELSPATPAVIEDLAQATGYNVGAACQAIKDLPVPNPTTPTPAPPGHDCKEKEDDNGFGGTHVECEYACQVGDELAIYVEAHDVTYGTAEADGYSECGGARADCDIHTSKNVCQGASVEPASRNEVEAECYGESHETFDDPVTVACYSFGTGTPCELFPSLPICNPDVSNQAMHNCLATHPEIVGDARAADLIGLIPGELVSSFVAFTFTATEGFAVGSTLLESGEVTCWGGPFALS